MFSAVVDLPGLIHSSNKKQTDTDISLVTDLVKDYISKDRTIICTVITSKNDAANQIILERAKAVDPKNERTFGILTKPDTLEEGSKNQATFIGLVRNEDTFLGLGWHILKNRAHGEEGYSPAERNEAEATFLSKGAWRDLPTYQKGVHCLRTRLSELLFQQIKKHLPDVRNEISRKLKGVNHDLDKLGKGRSTPAEQREYWFNTVRDFRDIARMAVSGYYSSDFFIGADLKEEKIVNRRLRARLQNIHLNFGQQMRLRGRKYIEKGDNAVVAETLQLSSEASSSTDDDNDDERCEFYLTGGPNQSIMMCGIPKQEKVSPVQMTRWIKKVLIRSRGRELPGLFQSLLVGELLWEQTSRWGHFATAHITACQELCSDLVEEILQSLVPQDGRSASQLLGRCDYADSFHQSTLTFRPPDSSRRSKHVLNQQKRSFCCSSETSKSIL